MWKSFSAGQQLRIENQEHRYVDQCAFGWEPACGARTPRFLDAKGSPRTKIYNSGKASVKAVCDPTEEHPLCTIGECCTQCRTWVRTACALRCTRGALGRTILHYSALWVLCGRPVPKPVRLLCSLRGKSAPHRGDCRSKSENDVFRQEKVKDFGAAPRCSTTVHQPATSRHQGCRAWRTWCYYSPEKQAAIVSHPTRSRSASHMRASP